MGTKEKHETKVDKVGGTAVVVTLRFCSFY